MDPGEAVILKAVQCHKETKEVMDRGDSAVQQFYCDAVVFVTGGSGFLGKQLIEKLFRSCKIKKLLMMMRAKKGKSMEERLADILKEPLYDTLREEQPDFQNRIQLISGELAEKDLAVIEADKDSIIEEVDVIFHVAATISFQEPLRSATFTNVRGTRDLLALAKKCKKLRSFIYMSTAYSHATYSRRDSEVLEQFYPVPIDPHLMIKLAENLDEQRLNNIKDGLIMDWPNTYSFTKALAEELVRSSAGDLPLSVIRPSVVVCARREPYAGWIDISSVFGPSGITLGCMMGVLHVLQTKPDIRIDFVPVDYVTNTAIVAAATAGCSVNIYHVATSYRNHITWGGLTNILNNVARRSIVSEQAIWYCFVVQTPYRWIHQVFSFLLHTIPANLVDGLCVLLKKPPRLKNTYATVTKMAATIVFYTTNNWIFKDSNTVKMYERLSKNDKLIYHCDVSDIQWVDQIVLWCVGIRKYIVKDGLKNTKLGMRKQFFFRIATYVISGVFVFFILCSIFKIMKFVCGLE